MNARSEPGFGMARAIGGLVAVALALGTVLARAADVSQIKVGALAGNTSITTANSYYPTSLTSTREFWGPDPNANRPVELKELARALRNDVDLIYEYVHDNIRTTFMYGLQKGALGALIDQSGTPFDQAHLMVELLREAGYSVRYKVGTLVVSTVQANAWIGSNNTTALQQILRDGAIPLGYSGGNFTIGHIWVEVTIPGATCGSTCWFDPSYKQHTFRPTLNLESLMGWSGTEFTSDANGFLNKAWVGLQQQPTPADPVWVSNINNSNIETKLQSYASSLLTNLKSATHKDKEIEDVVGGQDIVKSGSGPIRNNNSLPGFTTAVQRSWDCTGSTTCGIPDPYRTKLVVSMLNQSNPDTNPPLITKTFFADEVYGRRIYFDTPNALSLPDEGSSLETFESWCIKLAVSGSYVSGAQTGCTGTTPDPPFRDHKVRLEVDHPYAAVQPGIGGAPAGSYMDLSVALGTHIQKRADFALPVVIVHGWGDVSPALISKLSSEQIADRLLPVSDPPGTPEPGDTRSNSSMDLTMIKLGASFLAQYSRMAELQKRMGNADHVMHHMVGMLYAEATMENDWPIAQQGQSIHDWYVSDRAIRINVDGAISVSSKSNTPLDRQKVIHSTLAAAAALEGSIFEQMLDSPEVGSTATRFQWGNANLGSNLKFYLYTPTTPGGQIGTGFTSLGCNPTYGGGQSGASIPSYVNATSGFWAIAASELCLGPGNKYGPQISGFYQPTMQRGGAYVAFKPDSSSVAHVATYFNAEFKGGGAGVAASYATEFDPTGAASLLKDKFDDRSRLHGVDLQSGDLTYSAPTDIRVGEGGFPYKLSLDRKFKAGASHSPGLPDGWAHSLDIRASISGDGLAAMGRDSAWNAASTIAALYTAQKTYSVSPAPATGYTATQLRDHLKRWVLAPFVMNWWESRLTYNVVTINAGHDARQFTRLADGTFNPPRNGVGTLIQTGDRTKHQATNLPAGDYDRWDYSPMSFTYTSPGKDVQTFSYFEFTIPANPLNPVPEKSVGRRHGWHLATWTFPYGVNLTFSYIPTAPSGDNTDRVTAVQNNLGRALSFTYAGTNDTPWLSTVSDGQGRTVQYSATTGLLTQVTSPETSNGAEITKYQYIGAGQNTASVPAGARPQIYPKLWKAFAPSDATDAKMQVDYDRTWRTKEYRDAVAVKTPAQRNPHSYFVTGTNRGERADPLGNPYTVYYDDRGRAIQFIDEEDRIVNQGFDNHDRVAQRTFPEGNRIQLTYDDVTQQVKQLTQLPKSSTYWSGSVTNIVASATYDPACARIKTVTDAKGKITTWTYNTTTCTLTSVQQPQVANPQAGGALANPLTQYLYNGFGQMTQITDPTGRIVTFDYDATTHYRLRRHVNPAGLNLTTVYGHNAYGDINVVTDPRGNITNYTFDKQRRLTRIDAPLASTTIHRYDLDGDLYRVERAMNAAQTQWQLWTKTFTPTKKVYQETSPTNEVTTYSYDGADRVDVVTDPDGRKVRTEYFNDGRTKRIIKAFQSPTMPALNYATYTRTPNGQIDTVADANSNVTNLNYDAFDRLARTFYPDPASGSPCTPVLPHSALAPVGCTTNQRYEELGYDANGNVTSKRNRDGQTVTMASDALNRETTRTVPANPLGHFARTLTTSYDLASRQWDLTADGQTLAHRYDAAGRLDYVDDSYLGASNRVDHGYDPAGNRTSVVYPGGTSVTYSYDALNRMDTVTEGGVTLADYDWDTLSRRDLVRFNNNGFTADLGYENDDDLNSLAHTGAAALTFTLGRNHSSQITSLAASDGAFLSRPAATVSDTYVPNRLNQYTTVAGVTQSYDANGNLTSDGTYTYEYDEENRLRSAAGAGNSATYEYDPLGRRRAKIVTGPLAGTTKFASDGAEEIEERDGSNNVLRKYVYGPAVDDRIAMLDTACAGGGRCFYLTNWQGSATTLINQNNTVNATYHYGPFGEGANWTPSDAQTGNPFRYTGRRVDPETGLYYYRARYYSPKLGRFLQTDPIGVKDDLNLYAYVHGDPLNQQDSLGTWSTRAHDQLLQVALRAQLNTTELGRVQRGSAYVDTVLQFNNAAHSLRDVGQPVPEAIDLRENFIAQNLARAVEAGVEGDIPRMLNRFGRAMHAVMDKHSPAHTTNEGPNEYSVARGDTIRQGHSPIDSTGREGTDDITPEIQEAVSAEINKHFNEVIKQVSEARSQKPEKVLCTGSRIERDRC